MVTAPSELLPISGRSSPADRLLQKPCRTPHVGGTESQKGVFLSWVQSGPKGKELDGAAGSRGCWGPGWGSLWKQASLPAPPRSVRAWSGVSFPRQ